MENVENVKERRAYVRYRISDHAIAIYGEQPGRIKDISLGGLSLVYLDIDKTSDEDSRVDLLDSHNNFFMERLPCRTVTNNVSFTESPFSIIPTVKRSVQFSGLSDLQKAKLETYIQASATGRA